MFITNIVRLLSQTWLLSKFFAFVYGGFVNFIGHIYLTVKLISSWVMGLFHKLVLGDSGDANVDSVRFARVSIWFDSLLLRQ